MPTFRSCRGSALKERTTIPYQEYEALELKQIMDIKLKEKISKKQLDKWITYKCDVCGKENKQLISHYNKNKHHYCSNECRKIGLKKPNKIA